MKNILRLRVVIGVMAAVAAISAISAVDKAAIAGPVRIYREVCWSAAPDPTCQLPYSYCLPGAFWPRRVCGRQCFISGFRDPSVGEIPCDLWLKLGYDPVKPQPDNRGSGVFVWSDTVYEGVSHISPTVEATRLETGNRAVHCVESLLAGTAGHLDVSGWQGIRSLHEHIRRPKAGNTNAWLCEWCWRQPGLLDICEKIMCGPSMDIARPLWNTGGLKK